MSKDTRRLPRVFVGSSREGIDFAYAVQANLEHDAEVTVWSQGVFEPSRTTIEALERQFSHIDFAIFVFTPDDFLRIRGEDLNAVRDNVIFELGLAMGKLGRDRSFIIRPRTPAEVRIPTDLLGITTLTFNPTRSDSNLEAALGSSCSQINRMIRQIANITHPSTISIDTQSIKQERRPAEEDSAATAAASKSDDETASSDEITRFAVEVANRTLARLPPMLRPQKHSRWAGQYQGARYYRLWYQNQPWHSNQFRFQLWLEPTSSQGRTLWVGFSMKSTWLDECGYPQIVATEIRKIIDGYASQESLRVTEESGFVGVNYEIDARMLTEPLIEKAANNLSSIITTLTPRISASLRSNSDKTNLTTEREPEHRELSANLDIRTQLKQRVVEGEVDSKIIADIFGVSQNWASGRACQANSIGRPILEYKRSKDGNALTGRDGRYRYNPERVLSFVDALEKWVSSSEGISDALPLLSATDERITTGQLILLVSIVGKPGMPASFASAKKYLSPPVGFCISSAGQGYSLLYPADRLNRLMESTEDSLPSSY